MPDQEPDPTPEQEREVRRLLADARHSEPMPTDVAARLDRVLADLAGQDRTPHDGDEAAAASVTSLASRRRRRVTALLVAAAAVVAVGVGVDQLTHAGFSGSGSATSDKSTVSSDSAGSAGSGDRPQRHRGKVTKQDSLLNGAMAPETSTLVRVRPHHFSADVTRARKLTLRSAELDATGEARGNKLDCTTGDWGSGTFVPVLYGGHRGVLVFRAVNGDTQVVDLFGCGSSDVLRSITLPAR